jgi:hypothetical protein
MCCSVITSCSLPARTRCNQDTRDEADNNSIICVTEPPNTKMFLLSPLKLRTWTYTFTPPYVFMEQCLVKRRDNFTATFSLLLHATFKPDIGSGLRKLHLLKYRT